MAENPTANERGIMPDAERRNLDSLYSVVYGMLMFVAISLVLSVLSMGLTLLNTFSHKDTKEVRAVKTSPSYKADEDTRLTTYVKWLDGNIQKIEVAAVEYCEGVAVITAETGEKLVFSSDKVVTLERKKKDVTGKQ